MEERESPISKLRGNKYSNLLDKIRNRRVGNDVAWHETQDLFGLIMEDYPQRYSSIEVVIREIFNIRRSAYLGETETRTASAQVQSLVRNLRGKNRELIDEPTVCIRDLFDIPAPNRRLRGF